MMYASDRIALSKPNDRDYLAIRWRELHGEPLSPEIPTDLAAQIVSICDTLDDCTRTVNETNAVLRRAQA